MPLLKPDSHARVLILVLLGAAVLLCGVLLRADEPIPDAQVALMTASPEPTPSPTPSPVPATPSPTPLITPSQAPTIAPTASPTMATAAPTATATATTAVTTTPVPSPQATDIPAEEPGIVFEAATAEPTPLPTATPRPGPTPTYEYADDDVKIEIIRHADANVVYFAAEIWLTDISQLKSAFSKDQFDSATEPVGDIASRNSAILAINGDFATFNNGGIIIRNGEVYRTNRSTRQLLLIDANGDFIPHIEPPEKAEAAAQAFLDEGIRHTLVFGPVLVADGKAVELPKKFFINTRGALEPRTAIAQLGPLHYLFLVVDGRQDDYSKGVSLPRLQEMFLEHGAQVAFNLDGGGSATLFFDGEVINKPANGGQRHVPDILYIGR